ncbi:MAG: ATPase [Deltaproteobacteria bacterium RIFOXYA12_FULL_61_11]|nr:MAG: ATPase [Deltaproteobacteria bacterium RIFOXYA12_FULL_61_11]
MSRTPFEQAGSLLIGTVDFVSPDEIKVVLDIEAPDSVALNTGGPRQFPRVNGYLLIPVDEAFLVGQVEWLTVERSAFPKRRGMQDFGLVDLPYPLRKLRLNPLGTLRKRSRDGAYDFRRGADGLPSIGAAVLLPTDSQLRSIVESGEQRRVKIGTSPLAGDAEVSIDPNRLFGRHLAVLGNTGSGKSCSVAGLIRWSLEQATHARSEAGATGRPNARFIVLDPNGEYLRAFSGDDALKARIFKVNPSGGGTALKVPLWFWNSAEWCSFTQASARTQRPLLRRALREVKAGRIGTVEPTEEERKLGLRRYLSSRFITIQRDLRSGAIQTDESKFGFRLKAMNDDLEQKHQEFPSDGLDAIREAIEDALKATFNTFVDKSTHKTVEYYRAFTEGQVRQIVDALRASLNGLGGVIYQEGPDDDIPLAFSGTDLADHLDFLAEQENVSQFLDFLVARIRTFLSDPKMTAVIGNVGAVTLETWLSDYIGNNNADGGCVSVIDLSLVPTEVVHVVTAVIARMVFEASQRYVKLNNGVALPTVLVMEEAHTFIKRYKEDVENQETASICCQVFERIAREGRKFGLGLVLSSQRPSELSPTVLSQCNTFLLHRISNDRDQELVNQLVPDNLRGLLRELPSLPSQSAILLGWASELPVLVKMNDLPKSQQPRSDDPDFWGVWVGRGDNEENIERNIDWSKIAADWQGWPPNKVEGQS